MQEPLWGQGTQRGALECSRLETTPSDLVLETLAIVKNSRVLKPAQMAVWGR